LLRNERPLLDQIESESALHVEAVPEDPETHIEVRPALERSAVQTEPWTRHRPDRVRLGADELFVCTPARATSLIAGPGWASTDSVPSLRARTTSWTIRRRVFSVVRVVKSTTSG
jgi:hypothetical protein